MKKIPRYNGNKRRKQMKLAADIESLQKDLEKDIEFLKSYRLQVLAGKSLSFKQRRFITAIKTMFGAKLEYFQKTKIVNS